AGPEEQSHRGRAQGLADGDGQGEHGEPVDVPGAFGELHDEALRPDQRHHLTEAHRGVGRREDGDGGGDGGECHGRRRDGGPRAEHPPAAPAVHQAAEGQRHQHRQEREARRDQAHRHRVAAERQDPVGDGHPRGVVRAVDEHGRDEQPYERGGHGPGGPFSVWWAGGGRRRGQAPVTAASQSAGPSSTGRPSTIIGQPASMPPATASRVSRPSQKDAEPNSERHCSAGRVTRWSVCSWVVPMAPWTWCALRTATATACETTLRATATRNPDSSPARSSVRASARAESTAARASMASAARSTTRFCTDWNFASARPNWLRSVVWPIAEVSIPSIAPTDCTARVSAPRRTSASTAASSTGTHPASCGGRTEAVGTAEIDSAAVRSSRSVATSAASYPPPARRTHTTVAVAPAQGTRCAVPPGPRTATVAVSPEESSRPAARRT